MNPALLGWVLLAALVGMAGAGTAGGWYGYSTGKAAGAAEVQTAWDHAKELAEARKEADSTYAAKLDTDVTTFLSLLEKRYARSPIAKALDRGVTCPKSGKVGDVVLPADLVDGMFNRPPATGTSAAPAASGVAASAVP